MTQPPAPFRFLVRRSEDLPNCYDVSFSVEEGTGVLRIARGYILVDRPAAREGQEQGLTPEQIRDLRFLHVGEGADPRTMFSLGQVHDRFLESLHEGESVALIPRPGAVPAVLLPPSDAMGPPRPGEPDPSAMATLSPDPPFAPEAPDPDPTTDTVSARDGMGRSSPDSVDTVPGTGSQVRSVRRQLAAHARKALAGSPQAGRRSGDPRPDSEGPSPASLDIRSSMEHRLKELFQEETDLADDPIGTLPADTTLPGDPSASLPPDLEDAGAPEEPTDPFIRFCARNDLPMHRLVRHMQRGRRRDRAELAALRARLRQFEHPEDP